MFREEDLPELNWQDRAGCIGVEPEVFMSDEPQDVAYAKSICAECVVKEACLNFALTKVDDSQACRFTWGEKSGREIARLRRQRRINELTRKYKEALSSPEA